MLPLAKPYFYISKHSQVATPINADQTEYQPVIDTCVPLYACLSVTGLIMGWMEDKTTTLHSLRP